MQLASDVQKMKEENDQLQQRLAEVAASLQQVLGHNEALRVDCGCRACLQALQQDSRVL
jgi:hypothetical protein